MTDDLPAVTHARPARRTSRGSGRLAQRRRCAVGQPHGQDQRNDDGAEAEHVDDYISAGGCYVPRNEQAGITIDGHSGRISDECPDKVVATVVVDGRLYLFAMLHNRSDARALFDAFAATIDLRPEDAAAPQ